jgi:hypothetical protein
MPEDDVATPALLSMREVGPVVRSSALLPDQGAFRDQPPGEEEVTELV